MISPRALNAALERACLPCSARNSRAGVIYVRDGNRVVECLRSAPLGDLQSVAGQPFTTFNKAGKGGIIGEGHAHKVISRVIEQLVIIGRDEAGGVPEYQLRKEGDGVRGALVECHVLIDVENRRLRAQLDADIISARSEFSKPRSAFVARQFSPVPRQ